MSGRGRKATGEATSTIIYPPKWWKRQQRKKLKAKHKPLPNALSGGSGSKAYPKEPGNGIH